MQSSNALMHHGSAAAATQPMRTGGLSWQLRSCVGSRRVFHPLPHLQSPKIRFFGWEGRRWPRTAPRPRRAGRGAAAALRGRAVGWQCWSGFPARSDGWHFFFVPRTGILWVIQLRGKVGTGPWQDQKRMGRKKKSGCWSRERSFCIIWENATVLENCDRDKCCWLPS